MYFVYLLASKRYGTLYIGWTINLDRRVWEHKNEVVPGFTAKYGADRLVWFENHHDREAALRWEKRIKGWRRDWKINLIESQNRYWIDLYDSLPGA
jgi:putative endonuclease